MPGLGSRGEEGLVGWLVGGLPRGKGEGSERGERGGAAVGRLAALRGGVFPCCWWCVLGGALAGFGLPGGKEKGGRGWASAAGRTVYPGVRMASGTEEEEESCRRWDVLAALRGVRWRARVGSAGCRRNAAGTGEEVVRGSARGGWVGLAALRGVVPRCWWWGWRGERR